MFIPVEIIFGRDLDTLTWKSQPAFALSDKDVVLLVRELGLYEFRSVRLQGLAATEGRSQLVNSWYPLPTGLLTGVSHMDCRVFRGYGVA